MTLKEMWLRLSAVKRLDAASICQIVDAFIDDGMCDAKSLSSYGLSEEQIQSFFNIESQRIFTALDWLEAESHHLITLQDAHYPLMLKHISSAPPVLFVKGQLPVLATPQLAMVGSRHYSDYGEQWAQYFAAGLVSSGFTITSGLALGIDGISHRAALEAGGKTIAVLGSGLMKIHPRSHLGLADRILESGGALVSELWPDTPAMPANFPRRNRIISGMSAGVLVVEASLRSGSLITARYALEQDRDVFALPGPLENATSVGTHWLIKQGAYLVTEPNDIAEQIGSGLTWLPTAIHASSSQTAHSGAQSSTKEIIYAQDNEVELPFADVLANVEYEVTPVDVVAERAGQPVPDVVGKLLELELAGWIAAVPGGYVRIRRAGHVRRTNVLI
ncbi:DNA-protecting protein DprA [Ewingella americana]|uniref:DNA-protecting protein DprA n=1 Tax=Ewingella americana TaxID=41202 RepID=UPI001861D387|nr:DNA-protecting protein DprA [Ewingella americana]QMV50200.1 DNA-protecting protein DprA [Ewingella americana]